MPSQEVSNRSCTTQCTATVYEKRILIGGHYQWIPKGLIEVLTERGCYNRTRKLEDMWKEITTHPDFKNEKMVLERFINNRGHAFLFIPKYHCQLNAIELCWSQAKRYTRAYCNYSITGLRRNIPSIQFQSKIFKTIFVKLDSTCMGTFWDTRLVLSLNSW